MRVTRARVARVVIERYAVESRCRYRRVSMRTRTALDVTRRVHSRAGGIFRLAALVINWAELAARLPRRPRFVTALDMRSMIDLRA